MSIDVSIIIVTYKTGLDILRQCFEYVKNIQDLNTEVFVIDNEPSNAVRGLLASYPKMNYIRNESNKGFAAAVNQGMHRSNGQYILLLNPDVSFDGDVLKKMVKRMEKDSSVGISSCAIKYPDGSHQESIRRFPTLKDQILILLKVPHFIKTKLVDKYMMRDIDASETQDVDSIMGAFMLINRSVIEQIGYLDERYFIWFEEVDYCKVAKEAGWKIMHYADCEIIHHKGVSFDQVATLRKQKWIRTSLRKYMYKHHGMMAALILWLWTPIFILSAYIASFIKPK